MSKKNMKSWHFHNLPLLFQKTFLALLSPISRSVIFWCLHDSEVIGYPDNYYINTIDTDLRTVHTCTEPAAASVCMHSAARLHMQVQHRLESEEKTSEFPQTQSSDQTPTSVHQLGHTLSLKLLHGKKLPIFKPTSSDEHRRNVYKTLLTYWSNSSITLVSKSKQPR